jgi:heparosan-N-sulfate-glucuronate 5-epimerase
MKNLIKFILVSIVIMSCSNNENTSIDSVFNYNYKNLNTSCINTRDIHFENNTFNFTTNTDSINYELVSGNLSSFDKYTKDSNNIPMLMLNDSLIYYPITIAQAAVTYFKNYSKTNDSNSKKTFLELANWLKENFRTTKDFGFWICKEPYSGYNTNNNWPSAMAQGIGLMAMAQAFYLTNDSSYYKISKKALRAFNLEIKDGGFTRKHKDGFEYEEYPSSEPTRVLNGFIFSLAGLYDYYELTKDNEALLFFNKGIKFLKNNICKYDLPFTSRYNLYEKNPQLANGIGTGAGDGYHHLHIIQLGWLFKKTKEEIFLKYALIFLEKDMGNFDKSYLTTNKIESINTTKCIDCVSYGPNNLHDGIWSYGKYWSYKNKSELIIDLGELRENIESVVFYYGSLESIKSNIKVYKLENSNWIYQEELNINKNSDYIIDNFNTGSYKTFIVKFALKKFASNQIKIEIDNPNLYIIREIDIHYDRTKEIIEILNNIK